LLIKFDELVKSRKLPFYVIPAKAGIQSFQSVRRTWTPVFTGVTTFYETVKFDGIVKSPTTVMPDLIRHPEDTEITGFRLSPE
jgi:hypothetical protein